MKFAVLGANSFTGNGLCEYLQERGDTVLKISRPLYDLNKDLEAIVSLIHASRPTHIVNLIAQGLVAESWLKPEDWFQTNVVAHVALHNKLRLCDFIEKYVHVSTPEVYGSTRRWVTEDHPFNPSTPYAASKAACEMSLMTFYRAYGFPVVFTRSANVYGPGQRNRIIPLALQHRRDGTPLKLQGEGKSRRSFVHVHDVSTATRLIAEKGNPGEAYHISTWQLHSIREVVNMIGCETADAQARIEQDEVYALHTGKIRELGWEPTISLEQGIEQMEPAWA